MDDSKGTAERTADALESIAKSLVELLALFEKTTPIVSHEYEPERRAVRVADL